MHEATLPEEIANYFKYIRKLPGLFGGARLEYILLGLAAGLECDQRGGIEDGEFLALWRRERRTVCLHRDNQSTLPFTTADLDQAFSQVTEGLNWIFTQYRDRFNHCWKLKPHLRAYAERALANPAAWDLPFQFRDFGKWLMEYIVASSLPRIALVNFPDFLYRDCNHRYFKGSSVLTMADLSLEKRWIFNESDVINQDALVLSILDWYETQFREFGWLHNEGFSE